MKKILLKEIYEKTEEYCEADIEVNVAGWVRTIRDSKSFGFLEINDGSCFRSVQVVFEETVLQNFKQIIKLNVGSSLKVTGKIVLTPNMKQPFEIKASDIEITGNSTPDYPLQKKRHSYEFLRDIAHLRPRTNTFSAIFRLRSVAAFAIHKFFNEHSFIYVHTPLITASDAEGAGEMFKVSTLDFNKIPMTEENKIDYTKDFFGKSSKLTVSGQLEAECFALAFGQVYTFGPTFRAENSNTTRHAAEFWMIEPEIAFSDLQDDMNLAQEMIKFVISEVLSKCPEEMKFFNEFFDKGLIERLESIVNSEFGCITYTEAVKILEENKDKFEYPVFWGCDLQTEHERFLTEQIFKRPVFIIDYPRDIKAFYMRLNDDNKTVAAMDLLVPGIGEIIGGSQREERLDILKESFEKFNLKEEDYWWYMDLRRYGGTKHAGFGLGFERLIMYLTGVSNIRDVIPFPRTVGSADF
ncbi:MAG: asnS [Clostridia bacterium]|nr:asnS [Clostridia bacterium]